MGIQLLGGDIPLSEAKRIAEEKREQGGSGSSGGGMIDPTIQTEVEALKETVKELQLKISEQNEIIDTAMEEKEGEIVES